MSASDAFAELGLGTARIGERWCRLVWNVQHLGLGALAGLSLGCATLPPRAAPVGAVNPTALRAIRIVQTTVKVGDPKAKAITELVKAGFACRPLSAAEFGRIGPEHAEEWTCWTSTDRTAAGYTLVYGSLAVDRQGRLIRVGTGSYPVTYRNLRADGRGGTIVAQDPAPVRPVVATDKLQGRWAIVAVNGKRTSGLWLDLGGEGLGTVTGSGNAIFVASPEPRTRAFLGCNDWRPNGWTRNGDKLTLGTEMSSRTERGCDAARMALDDEAYAILHRTMTMELTPLNRLRLINEKGTVDLVRSGN
ncbi:MAG: hypothetical protein ACJ8FG_04385 [Sphingomicrobium sp.]